MRDQAGGETPHALEHRTGDGGPPWVPTKGWWARPLHFRQTINELSDKTTSLSRQGRPALYP
ncbi:hypothetical protein ppKF707_3288 [Metapseudomonas furukawaii]|uniref:Uncharacterized protein n=1 Tax=Metapseudomonas furukawaii TaxID=1149133 RepID=A0AAD1BTS7_METFU|nr:hypothetical protein ppKF707_3288 [Pseudomonas furukawaii]BAU71959.1 hypothetical protein KF707C_2710 [Pseudomonas furukawaii]